MGMLCAMHGCEALLKKRKMFLKTILEENSSCCQVLPAWRMVGVQKAWSMWTNCCFPLGNNGCRPIFTSTAKRGKSRSRRFGRSRWEEVAALATPLTTSYNSTYIQLQLTVTGIAAVLLQLNWTAVKSVAMIIIVRDWGKGWNSFQPPASSFHYNTHTVYIRK